MERKHGPDLARPRSHRHQHGDVAVLLHHHHGQGDKDIERRHQHDQADGQDGHQALQAKGAEERAVLLHPGRGVESRAGRLADGLGDHGGLVDIINPEFDHRRHARQIEQALRGAQVRKGPGGVKIIEARVEHAHDAEMAELRYYTVRRERTLRAGHQHRVTHEDAERLGQLLADDQRVGVREAFGEARERPLLDSGEQVGNPHLALGVDAFQHHALSARAG